MLPESLGNRPKGLLCSLERYTKTDLTYLSKGGLWLTLDVGGGALAGLILSVAFAYLLPKEVYGTYRFLIALFWVLTAFTMTGLSSAMSRAVTQGHEGVFRSSFALSIRFALPLSGIALCMSAYYFFQGNAVLGSGLLIIAALGPLMQSATLWSSYFVGKKNFKALFLYGLIFAFVPALCLIAVMQTTKDPLVLIFTYLASTILSGMVIARAILTRHRPNSEPDAEYKNLGWHFSVMNLLSTIAQQVDKIVVFHYLGAVELAVYALATALPEQIRSVFGSVSTLALPKFITRPFSEIKKTFWYRVYGFTGLLVITAIGYVLIAPSLFKIFFPAYQEAIFYSQIFALSLVPAGNTLSITLLEAHKAKRELYIFNVVSPIFQIGALILLTSIYGLIGAVTARIASRVWAFIIGGALVTTYGRRERLVTAILPSTDSSILK